MYDANEALTFESTWDLRRKSWSHFQSRAHEARISSYILYNFDPQTLESKFGSSTQFAITKGFRREFSIAIELIIKSLMCLQEGKEPKPSHDVFDLWKDAGLPELDNDGNYRLSEICEILYWSGRYPAPLRDNLLLRSRERFEKFSRRVPGLPKAYKVTSLSWDDFDNLYQIVNTKVVELSADNPT